MERTRAEAAMSRREIDDRGSSVWVDHDGVVAETAKAKCFAIQGEDIWVPKSLIEDEGDEVVAVPPWFAEKEGIEGDW